MTEDLKKIGDKFVNSCTATARNAINQNHNVEVLFKIWQDGKEPKVQKFCFPPPPPPAKTSLEQENSALRDQLSMLEEKNKVTEASVELLRQQIEFLRLEMTK